MLKQQENERTEQSMDFYRLIFKRSLNGMAYHRIVTDKSGKPVDYIFLDVNDSFQSLTGLKRDDIIGKTVKKVIKGIENDKADWIKKYGEIALEGKEMRYDLFSDLLNKWFAVFAYSPKKGYFIAEFTDITAEMSRRTADEAVKAERQRFNNVFEILPAYLILLTPDYHINFANKFFRDRFGDPKGRRCFEYLFGRDEPCEVCETYKVLKTMKPLEWEWTGPDKRDYYIYDFPFKDIDGSTMILEMGIDITELKQVQEALRVVNDNLEESIRTRTSELRERSEDLDLAQSVGHIGSWRLQVPSNELIWSDETYRIFEVSYEFPLTYETFLSFVHPDDQSYVSKKWSAALQGEPYNIEHRIIANGKVKWVSEKAILEFDGNNNLISGFGITQDITGLRSITEKLRRGEEQLRIKNENLTRINAMLEDFVSIAAHDLRSPVASMKAISGLIEYIPEMNRRVELFKDLMQIVNRLDRTIDGLVETINIQKNENIPCKSIELKKICNEALSNLSEQIEKHGAVIKNNFKKDSSVVFVEAYLLSIFTNMISNSLKYCSPSRKPLINITEKRSGEYVLLSFSDNGIGIDLGKAGKDMFKPFRRFTDTAEGKGMGLYIIKSIIEKNGGRIEVRSEVGRGTTFDCYLKEYTPNPL